jgi:hypothetical protein
VPLTSPGSYTASRPPARWAWCGWRLLAAGAVAALVVWPVPADGLLAALAWPVPAKGAAELPHAAASMTVAAARAATRCARDRI